MRGENTEQVGSRRGTEPGVGSDTYKPDTLGLGDNCSTGRASSDLKGLSGRAQGKVLVQMRRRGASEGGLSARPSLPGSTAWLTRDGP